MFRTASGSPGVAPPFLETLERRCLFSAHGVGADFFSSTSFDGEFTPMTAPQVKLTSPRQVPVDGSFSVKWIGYLEPSHSHVYHVYTPANDGVKLVVDGQTLIDHLSGPSDTLSASVRLTRGKRYAFSMEYISHSGDPAAKLDWKSGSDPIQVIPTSNLFRGKSPGAHAYSHFAPGTQWDDTDGTPIQAHGGDMLYQDGVYYWYGEDKNTKTYAQNGITRANAIGISVYASNDLYNWTDEGLALTAEGSGDLSPSGVLERPKVLYNAATGKYVMWMHVDNAKYTKARIGVAVSDSPIGPFVYQGSFRPLGMDSRDMTVFQDDDGTTYAIFATDQNQQIRIAQMTPDYLGLTGESVQPFTTSDQREAPEMFKSDGKYYLITSGATWFDPNAAEYAVSDSPMGHYTIVGNPAQGDGASTTFDSQGAFVFQVAGTDEFIFMADRWNKKNLGASSYVWLPIQINNGRLKINPPQAWSLSAFPA
jgi:Glycosyl hydrolases family 43/PA14 domain